MPSIRGALPCCFSVETRQDRIDGTNSSSRWRIGSTKNTWRRSARRAIMAKKWRDLYATIPPDRRACIEAEVTRDLAEMALAEVRRARELTQQQIAKNLDVNQAWVSKVERQTDMYVSTLRSYIE